MDLLDTALTEHPITVLMIDDQQMMGEVVRRMLDEETDIKFNFCQDPTKALATANEMEPTVILQDLVMPEIDGLTLVKFLRANEKTRDVPLIVLSNKEEPVVKAEAFALGANDYLVKFPDKIELLARIRHHSRGYINLLERNEAFSALEAKQRELEAELDKAAGYVQSLLPEPVSGDVSADWTFIPSTSLGGDSFGYHWIDENHFAMYLLDVCGHGVGAALLSVSAMNVLRAQTLPGVDFLDPSSVMKGLNETFEMEAQNNMYFTMWYGVYKRDAHSLTFSSAGHPPALLFRGEATGSLELSELKMPGMVVGALEGMEWENRTVELAAFNKLFIFSDGIYELETEPGEVMDFQQFVDEVTPMVQNDGFNLEPLLQRMKELNGSELFEDDYSIVQFIIKG